MQTLLNETRGPFLYMEFFSYGFIFSPTHTNLERDRDPVMLLLELWKVTLIILIVCSKQTRFLPTSKSCNLLSEYLYSQQAKQNRSEHSGAVRSQLRECWTLTVGRDGNKLSREGSSEHPQERYWLLSRSDPQVTPVIWGKLAVCCKRECLQKADHNKQFAFHNIQQQKTILSISLQSQHHHLSFSHFL